MTVENTGSIPLEMIGSEDRRNRILRAHSTLVAAKVAQIMSVDLDVSVYPSPDRADFVVIHTDLLNDMLAEMARNVTPGRML